MTTIKYSELSEAVEFVSAGFVSEHRAYIPTDTGRIYWLSDSDPLDDDVPDDVEDSDAYIAVPHKNELDLGRDLALRFVEQEPPDDRAHPG